MKFFLILNFLSEKAHKKAGKLGGRPPASAQIAPAAPLALAPAPQNGPGDQGMQLEEAAADDNDMAIEVHIEKMDDRRTRGMQYIIILYDVRSTYFLSRRP